MLCVCVCVMCSFLTSLLPCMCGHLCSNGGVIVIVGLCCFCLEMDIFSPLFRKWENLCNALDIYNFELVWWCVLSRSMSIATRLCILKGRVQGKLGFEGFLKVFYMLIMNLDSELIVIINNLILIIYTRNGSFILVYFSWSLWNSHRLCMKCFTTVGNSLPNSPPKTLFNTLNCCDLMWPTGTAWGEGGLIDRFAPPHPQQTLSSPRCTWQDKTETC